MRNEDRPILTCEADVKLSLYNMIHCADDNGRPFPERLETIRRACMEGTPLTDSDYRPLFVSAVHFAREHLGENFPSPATFAKLLLFKGERYGPSPIRSWGCLGVAIRLHSKYERWRNLNKTASLPTGDETQWDTLVDILGYAVLGDRLVLENLTTGKK